MGDLVRTPFSEVTATLEVFDRFGITPGNLRYLRDNPQEAEEFAKRLQEPILDSYVELNRSRRGVETKGKTLEEVGVPGQIVKVGLNFRVPKLDAKTPGAAHLLMFKDVVTCRSVFRYLERTHLVPGSLTDVALELLSHDVRRTRPVIGLGSSILATCSGKESITDIFPMTSDYEGKVIDFVRLDEPIDLGTRFLVFR